MSLPTTITGEPFSPGDTLPAQTLDDIKTNFGYCVDNRSGQSAAVASNCSFSGTNSHTGNETFTGVATFTSELYIPKTAFANLASIVPSTDGAMYYCPAPASTPLLYIWDASDTNTPSYTPFASRTAALGSGGCWKLSNYAVIAKETTARTVYTPGSTSGINIYQYTGGVFTAGNLIPISSISAGLTNSSLATGTSALIKAKALYEITAELSWNCLPFFSDSSTSIGDEIFGCLVAQINSGTYDAPLANLPLESLFVVQAASHTWTSGSLRTVRGKFTLNPGASTDTIVFSLAIGTNKSSAYIAPRSGFPVTFQTIVRSI